MVRYKIGGNIETEKWAFIRRLDRATDGIKANQSRLAPLNLLAS